MSETPLLRRREWIARESKVAMSPSGQRLAVSNDDSIQVFDFDDDDNERELLRVPLLAETLLAIGFTAKETSLVAIYEQEVRRHGFDETEETVPLDAAWQVGDAAFDTGSDRVAVFGLGGAALVEFGDHRKATFLSHPQSVGGAAFLNRQQLITSCRDGRLRIWNCPSRTLVRAIDVKTDTLNDVAATPEGRVVAVRSENRIVIVDVETGTTVSDVPQVADKGALTFLAKGRTLFAQSKGSYHRLWDTAGWQPTLRLQDLHKFERVSASADGWRIAAVSKDELLRIDVTPVKE